MVVQNSDILFLKINSFSDSISVNKNIIKYTHLMPIISIINSNTSININSHNQNG